MRQMLLSLGVLTVLASPALAGNQDFKLVNKTGAQIDEVYVSRVSSKNWGKDVMGSDSLDEDASVDITFDAPDNACRWDLRVKYNDGDTAEWADLNLCNIQTITLYWIARTTPRALSPSSPP